MRPGEGKRRPSGYLCGWEEDDTTSRRGEMAKEERPEHAGESPGPAKHR